jgi:hypothetical protein
MDLAMTEIRDVAQTEGTITITAEWDIDRSGGLPRLILRIDPGNLDDITGSCWQFDSLLSIGDATGTDLALLYYPDAADEGWDRVGEVGEW